MREDLLHFIWKTNKLQHKELTTTSGEPIVIQNLGLHNQNTGPDFFNAKLVIAGQVWAGNVEMHLKSSDWYAHGHETDSNYDNVILHVVWEDDVAVFRKDKTEIPTLTLQNLIATSFLDHYRKLLYNSKRTFVNCEKDLASVDGFLRTNWAERLYIERLEQKSKLIFDLLKASKNDWEAVLFKLLLKNFGLKVNGEAFRCIAEATDFSVIRKLGNDVFALESVLLGQARLFDIKHDGDAYYDKLQKEYAFQKAKFLLRNESVQKPDFFGLRPNNFPTIRLSQFANLYASNESLFSKVVQVDDLGAMYTIFHAETSDYWRDHYTFGKVSKSSKKRSTKSFIDLLLINTIIPLKFAYQKIHGKMDEGLLLGLAMALGPEKNNIISKFDEIDTTTKNAFESQSRLQLYNEYCSKNQCLRCKIGTALLNKNG